VCVFGSVQAVAVQCMLLPEVRVPQRASGEVVLMCMRDGSALGVPLRAFVRVGAARWSACVGQGLRCHVFVCSGNK